MTRPNQERVAELRDLGRTIAETTHDDLSRETIADLRDLVGDVESDLADTQRMAGARKLLAFWEAFVGTKLGETGEPTGRPSDAMIARFERAFDQNVMGVDLYQALETLAIVADMPEEEADGDRLGQWATRVHALTQEYLAHLESHSE